MKTSSAKVALLLLIAAVTVVSALTTTDNKEGQGQVEILRYRSQGGVKKISHGSRDLRELYQAAPLVHHHEKRSYNPGYNTGFNPGNTQYCTPCPPCFQPGGIGSVRKF